MPLRFRRRVAEVGVLVAGLQACSAITGLDAFVKGHVADFADASDEATSVDANVSATDGGAEEAAPSCSADLMHDPENCGACGRSCEGASCVDGLCEPALFLDVSASALATDGEYLYIEDPLVGRRVDAKPGDGSTSLSNRGMSRLAADTDGLYAFYGGGFWVSSGGAAAEHRGDFPTSIRLMAVNAQNVFATFYEGNGVHVIPKPALNADASTTWAPPQGMSCDETIRTAEDGALWQACGSKQFIRYDVDGGPSAVAVATDVNRPFEVFANRIVAVNASFFPLVLDLGSLSSQELVHRRAKMMAREGTTLFLRTQTDEVDAGMGERAIEEISLVEPRRSRVIARDRSNVEQDWPFYMAVTARYMFYTRVDADGKRRVYRAIR